MTNAAKTNAIQNAVAILKAKQEAEGWDNLTADEKMIVNQYHILDEYTTWLQSPLAQQSGWFVKRTVEKEAESQAKFVQTMCESYELGVSYINR